MEEDFKKIVDHFGVTKQIKKFAEESFELQEALLTDDYTKQSRKHIIEELCDCLIIINQFKTAYDITDDELADIINFKIDRTLKRIEEGYYDR